MLKQNNENDQFDLSSTEIVIINDFENQFNFSPTILSTR